MIGTEELRFKNNGQDYPEWEKCMLGDIYVERNERGNDSLPILSVSIHDGVSDGELDEDELGKKVRRSEDKTKYKRVFPGDLVFNMMRAWQGAVGVVKTEGMISPAYIAAIPNEKVYPQFMDYYMRTDRMVNVLNSQSYGVTDFRKRLYWESFANIECVIPSIEEQKKLYRFFVLIDTQINTIKDQIECLNKQRAFCVKKVFSKEVRFSSDSDIFPDWEQCILGDLCDAGIVEMKRGKVIPKQDGSYPVYSSASTNNGLFCYSNEYMFDEELVTWSIDGGGRAFYRPKHKFSVTNVCGYIRVKNYEKINCRYLAYALDYVHSKMGFDYMTKALPTAIENIDVLPIPCIEEQIRISDFIKSFDEAILNKEEILATWERIKTGFMQKMLPCK